MSRILTAADRSALIRLASSMDKGSPERKAILSALKGASTPDGVIFKDKRRWMLDTSEPYSTPEIYARASPRGTPELKAIAKVVKRDMQKGLEMLQEYLEFNERENTRSNRNWVETMNMFVQKKDRASVNAMAAEMAHFGMPDT